MKLLETIEAVNFWVRIALIITLIAAAVLLKKGWQKMETVKVSTSAGYKGCGGAFAKIQENLVTDLIYADALLDAEKDCDLSSENMDILLSGRKKIEAFAKAHPDLIYGMCSCGEFVRRCAG